ncbi:MAG: hypothetical protein HOV80_01875 [Polyangiaceae bacterium]|nr:hypothetical protein [Polyangiaceae bacterium]
MVPRSALRHFVALAIGVVLWASASRAFAWVELTIGRDDVRVEIDRQGKARIEHRVQLLVSGGPLASFSIRGVDPDAEIEPGSFVVPEAAEKAGQLDGAKPVTVEKKTDKAPGTPRADLDVGFEGKGLYRGRYIVVVRYRTDLLATGSIAREGNSWLIRWLGPSWDHGLDNPRAAFTVPMGQTEPRAELPGAEAEGPQEDDGSVLSTVTRKGPVDVIELARLYAARGERIAWTFRIDARALDAGAPVASKPAPVPASDRAIAAPKDFGLEVLLGAGIGLFLLLAGLVVVHGHEVRMRAKERGVVPRPLVPLPLAVRACLGAIVYLAGMWLVLSGRASVGGPALAGAFALFVWYLPSRAKHEARPPGQWLPLRLGELVDRALPQDRGFFVLSSRAGLTTFASLFVIAVALGILAFTRSSVHLPLVLAGAAPLFSLFASGGRRSLPVDLAVDPIPLLRDVAIKLGRARPGLRLVPRVRLPQSSADADEIRLVAVVPEATQGLRSVEIGCGWAAGPGGYVILPEIVVRFEAGTPCAELASSLEASAKKGPGRKLDERVLVFTPKLPTRRLTVELALAVIDRLGVAQKRGAVDAAAEPPRTRRPKREVPEERRDAA